MRSHGVLAVLAALTLSACSNSPSAEERLADVEAENEELRGRIQELEEQLETSQAAAEDVKSEADEVRTASAQLRNEVDRLDTENWRDVVPDIESATGQMQTRHLSLDDSVGELDDTLAQ